MIETKVRVDSKVQEELNEKAKTISVVFMLVGTIGLIAYIILSVVLEPTPLWVELFLLFAVFLGVGLVSYLTTKNAIKAVSTTVAELELTFNEDHYILKEFKNGEETATLKVFYKDVAQVRETKNYLFIKPNKLLQAYHTVDKNVVSAEELAQIKKYLKKDKTK